MPMMAQGSDLQQDEFVDLLVQNLNVSSNSTARQNGLGSNGTHNGQSHFKDQNGNSSQNYHKEVGGQRREFNRSGYDFNPFGTPYFQSSLIPTVDMHGRDQEWQEFVHLMNFGASGHLQDAQFGGTATMSAPPPEEAHFLQSSMEKAEQYNPHYSGYHPYTGIAPQSDGTEGIYNPLFSHPPAMSIPQRNFMQPVSTNNEPPLALSNNSVEISPEGSPRSETEKGERHGEQGGERGGRRDGERYGKRHGERHGEWVRKEERQETTSENISRSWASIAVSSPDDPIPPQPQPTFAPQKNRTGEPKVKPVELSTAPVPPKREKSPTVPQFGPAVSPKLVEKYPSLAEVNITSVDCQPSLARFFVIKSYSEDDIHKSIKYNIWASTDSGNRRLDNAFRELANKGPLYLFFSVNASGQFCGLAQMLTPLDYNTKSSVWAQDKWNGQFKVRWILIKDIPNGNLRHIRLSNNENKPVTNSRDTQEILLDPGKELLRLFLNFKTKSSLLDDFSFYDKRQEEMKEKKEKKAKEKEESLPTGSSRRQRAEKN